jgi:hypothetical protein
MTEFVKFVPSRRSRARKSEAHASIYAKKGGSGVFRVLASGMEFLTDCGISLEIGDRIDFFRDPGSGRLAVKRNEEDGEFVLRGISGGKPGLCINAKGLTELVDETTRYRMSRGERGFAFFLTPTP